MSNLHWSFNPLSMCLQFVGIPLNWANKKKKKKKPPIKVIVVLLAIVLANFFINGSRGFEFGRFTFMEEIYYENAPFNGSPYLYLKYKPFGIVKLVGIITEMVFFSYVPFVHVTFVATILFDHNWKTLIFLLDKIQHEMKLDEQFYQKCRRICFVVLFQLAIVSEQ